MHTLWCRVYWILNALNSNSLKLVNSEQESSLCIHLLPFIGVYWLQQKEVCSLWPVIRWMPGPIFIGSFRCNLHCMLSLADSNFYYLSFFINTDPVVLQSLMTQYCYKSHWLVSPAVAFSNETVVLNLLHFPYKTRIRPLCKERLYTFWLQKVYIIINNYALSMYLFKNVVCLNPHKMKLIV